MTSKTKTVKTETVVDFSFVTGMVEYAQLQDDIRERSEKAEAIRTGMIEGLKTLKEKKWKDISAGVKEALALIPNIDQVGALGTLKTCFEYRILPTTLNADRLRKAKTWKNWQGNTVPNTYGKVHTKPGAGQKAEAPKAEAPKAEAPKAEAPKAEAPKAEAPKAEAPKSATGKVELPRVNVDGSETPIGKVEHWDTLYKGFTNHGLTALYFKQLAGGLGIAEKDLVATWIKVHVDFLAEAEKVLDKSKKG